MKLQFGAGVSSKNFKKAVDRNRIRRLIKEAWRLQKNELREMVGSQKQLSVFILYTAKEIEPYKRVSEKIKKVIDRLSQIVSEPN